MKIWSRIFIFFVLFLNTKAQSILPPEPENRLFEAESGVQQDSIILRQNETASGGLYLHMPDKKGEVIFQLDVDSTALYFLHIGYRAFDGDRAQHILINQIEYAPEIGFPWSPKWTEIRHAAGLQAGKNTVELSASWGNMDIDYIRVEGPVFEPPEIAPLRNTCYKASTGTDIYVQLNKNQNPFTGISHAGHSVPFDSEPVWYLQDAVRIRIPHDYLETLNTGQASLLFQFENTDAVPFRLNLRDKPYESPWTIVSLDVRHGTSVLMLLPTGKILLIDTGTEQMCRERVIPFLECHNIKPDYLWITHHHPDHDGGRNDLMLRFPDIIVKDYHDYHSDDHFNFEKLAVIILNSYENGNDQAGENSRSLSMRMEYHGFVYTHGGDIYAQNQQQILQRYTERNQTGILKTHVYHANHHFHGSVDVNYLRAVDPYLILVSGEEHVYGRGAYTTLVQQQVIHWLRENKHRFLEDLLAFEVGHVVLRIKDDKTWHYECYADVQKPVPYLISK